MINYFVVLITGIDNVDTVKMVRRAPYTPTLEEGCPTVSFTELTFEKEQTKKYNGAFDFSNF